MVSFWSTAALEGMEANEPDGADTSRHRTEVTNSLRFNEEAREYIAILLHSTVYVVLFCCCIATGHYTRLRGEQ